MSGSRVAMPVAAKVVLIVDLLPIANRLARAPLLASAELFAGIVWPRFWAALIWLTVLSAVFCTLRELGRVLGRERLRQIFLVAPDGNP